MKKQGWTEEMGYLLRLNKLRVRLILAFKKCILYIFDKKFSLLDIFLIVCCLMILGNKNYFVLIPGAIIYSIPNILFKKKFDKYHQYQRILKKLDFMIENAVINRCFKVAEKNYKKLLRVKRIWKGE